MACIDTVSITDYCALMSYIAERREEEKERRRSEILVAAEALYAKQGWDAVTMDQVARSARLSRALVYVYFRDKEDLLFAIGERAMQLLTGRFEAAAAGPGTGLQHVEAIGRAYMGYALEFPHYFDVCSRFQAHAMGSEPSANEAACHLAGDQVMSTVIGVIEAGIRDGSLRKDIGDPFMLALTLWAFTHGIIQLVMAKGADLARRGVAIPDFTNYAFKLLNEAMQQYRPT
jgi:TetR/AcrR family transcriptional regulator